MLLALGGSGTAQIVLDKCESVSWDEVNNRYLFSNIGDGSIVQINLEGVLAHFKTGLPTPLGTQIAENTLYVSVEPNILLGFDLTTGDQVMELPLSGRVDGITWDGGNYLYVVRTTGGIYKVDIAAQTYTTLISSGLSPAPQDILYDGAHNRLLVAHWTATQPTVLAVDLGNLAITNALQNPPVLLDGICMDDRGMIYLSSHATQGMSWRWDGVFDSPPAPLAFNLNEPAGCSYNARDGVLAIACFAGDSIAFIPMRDFDEDDIPAIWDNCPDHYNPDRADADWDGVGDACDACTDIDNDGFGDPGYEAGTCALDNCPSAFNPDQGDWDGDGFGDECDNCIFKPNPDQADGDGDNIGDACEGCCTGKVGDANLQSGDAPTIGDITSIIDMLFITTEEVNCLAEADVNQSGGLFPTRLDITIGDITLLIDHLFIAGPDNLPLPDCF
jgi:hypothetical protein